MCKLISQLILQFSYIYVYWYYISKLLLNVAEIEITFPTVYYYGYTNANIGPSDLHATQ